MRVSRKSMPKTDWCLERRYLGPTRVPALVHYRPGAAPKPMVILSPGGGNQPIDNCKELFAQTLPLDGEDLFKVYVDLPLHGERAVPDLGKRFRTDQVRLFLHPIVLGMARDIVHLIDELSQRPEVDAARIGVCGWSLGGQASLLAAAVDQRIKAAIGLSVPYDAEQGPRAPYPDTPAHCVWRTELDVLGVAPNICPTAILLIHGARDAWVNVESSRRLHAALKPHYASCPERLRYVEYPNMAHSISQADGEACAREQHLLKEEVARWFERFL
jgi:dienelactone hydrolase